VENVVDAKGGCGEQFHNIESPTIRAGPEIFEDTEAPEVKPLCW
jgi:hypothetical protein